MSAPVALLERDSLLAQARSRIEDARSSRGRILVVAGPAGIGKTALLDAVAVIAQASGSVVLRARAGELERDFPYGVVRQLFESHLRTRPADQRDLLLSGAASLAAPVVAPWITPGAESVAGETAFSVVHGLYWLTANLADETPLTLSVDDAHWADVGSLRFLLHLGWRLEGLPLLVVLGIRTGESPADSVLVSELVSQPGAETIRPGPLSPAGVGRMISAHLDEEPDPSFTAACHRTTGGSPFLVGELIGELAARGIRPAAEAVGSVEGIGSDTVARATLLRLARLPASATALARAASVLGEDGRLHLAARLAEIDLDEAVEAADALAAMNILRPGRPLGFVHPIVRSAIHLDLAPGARATAHARAADLLAAENADIDSIAAHLMLTEPRASGVTVERLRVAATGALARGAPESAASYLRRALAEGGVGEDLRARLLEELASAEKLVNPAAAVEHFRAALALVSDPVWRARLVHLLSDTLFFVGQWEGAVPLLERAIEECREPDPELAMRLELVQGVQASWNAKLYRAFRARFPQLRRIAEEPTPSGRMMSLVLAGAQAWRGAPPDEVCRMLEAGLAGPDLFADLGNDSPLIGSLFVGLTLTEQIDRALDIADRLAEDARFRGSFTALPFILMFRSWVHTRRGDLPSAEADLRLNLELARARQLPFARINGLWCCAEALVERAELEDVAREAAALEVGPELAMLVFEASGLEVRGRVRLALGDTAGGVADLQRCAETPFASGNPNGWAWRPALAVALAPTDRARARALAGEHLEAADRLGLPRGIGIALRALGLIEGSHALLEEAVRVLERSPARLEHARALVELGAAHRRANQRAAARDPLRQGMDLAHRCGATRLAERARDELAATGARPRRQALTGPEALTATERRIANMAADGMSNPEIAQTLFVTRKTVENHLARIYVKLGINSRTQLAGALHR